MPFFKSNPIYIGISRKMPPEKAQRLQAACDRLLKRGTLQKIVKKWIGK